MKNHKQETERHNQFGQIFVQTPSGDIIISDVSELATIALLLVAGFNVTQRFVTGRNVYLSACRSDYGGGGYFETT